MLSKSLLILKGSFEWQKSPAAPTLGISLPQAGGMTSDDILSVILMTIMVSGGDMKASAVYWWQKAVQWARQLSLHQLDSPHAVTSPDASGYTGTAIQSAYQKEQQRRTFWLLYCLDRHLALSYNREPLLVDGEHFVFQPLPEDQWQSLATRSIENVSLEERQQGPSLVISGKGFFEYFLPLMALLGDVITTRRLKSHPRITANNRAEFVTSVAQRLDLCDKSIENLGHPTKNTAWTPPAPIHQQSPSEAGHTVASATSPSEGGAVPRSSRLNPRCHLVIYYARFILCVLRILLHGEWDAITLLGSSSPSASSPLQNSVSDWITSPSFNECAGSAIKAAEVVSQILQDDPELSLMPYLFGIYLFHGSLILLLFADRMSSVHGGPNESVKRACEVIIRAHEACIVTLNTEFQRVFRKVMRITLLLVQAQARNLQSESTHGRGQDFLGTDHAASVHSPTAGQIAEIFTIRSELLGLLRWNCGGEGLAI